MQNKTEEKKSSGSTVLADDGFYFGIGAFETIAVEEGIPQLLAWHLERLRDSLAFFGIDQSVEEQEVLAYLNASPQSEEKQHGALKITVTAQNKLFGLRKNTYSEEQYQKGFRLGFSEIRRNETSPLTYHKTLGITDNIMEKRNAKKSGLDEKIFLNQKGQISEGTVSNIFFVRNGKLYTPDLSCGLLPGILREYLCETENVEEAVIYPAELGQYEECFVTNSLMGIMPVNQLGEWKSESREVTNQLLKKYESI